MADEFRDLTVARLRLAALENSLKPGVPRMLPDAITLLVREQTRLLDELEQRRTRK